MDATRALLLLTYIGIASAVRCKVCDGISDPQYCLKTVECAANEECFVERVIGDDNNIYFNSGCLSIEVCRLLSLTRRSELQVCHECCGSDHCNIHLCTAPASDDTKCYQCDDVERPQDCHNLVTCKPEEICYTGEFINNNFEKRHRMGCETRKRCTLLESIGRRRALGGQTCNECCPKNGCNRHLCFDAAQGPPGKSTLPPAPSVSVPTNLNPTASVLISSSRTTVLASSSSASMPPMSSVQAQTASSVPPQPPTTQNTQTAPPSTQKIQTAPPSTQKIQTAPPSTQKIQTAVPSTQTIPTSTPTQPPTQPTTQASTKPPSKPPTQGSTQTATMPPTQTSAQLSTSSATQHSPSPSPSAAAVSTSPTPTSSVPTSSVRMSTLPPASRPSSTPTPLVTSPTPLVTSPPTAVAMTTGQASSQSPGATACQDFNSDCANLNSTLGVCSPVTEVTSRFCAKFCGLCSDTTSVAPTAAMTTVPVSTGPPCDDTTSDCPNLNATLGVCDPVTEVTTRFCKKFCGLCP